MRCVAGREEVWAGVAPGRELDCPGDVRCRRTVWGIVDGALNEYDMRGTLLRSQTKEMLADAGLTGVTSLAWQKGSRLLLGMKDSNTVAVVNTSPRSAVAMVDKVYREQNDYDMDVELEPPGEDVLRDILRELNMIEVMDKIEVGAGLIPPGSLGAVAGISKQDDFLFVAEGSVYKSSLDGTTGTYRTRPCPSPIMALACHPGRPPYHRIPFAYRLLPAGS